ncbi:MAG: O-antigen ligase family protein [Ilumatobacter sp.]
MGDGRGRQQPAVTSLPERTLVAAASTIVVAQVLINPAGFDQFQLPTLIVQSIAVVVGVASMLVARGPVAHRSFLALGSILAALTLSAVLSEAPRVSLLGTPARRFGVVQWLLLAGAFVIGSVLSDPHRRKQLCRVLVATSAIVSVYAIVQRLGFDPFDSDGAATRFRPGSSFGSATALGGYLAFVVPVTFGSLLKRFADWRWLAPVLAVDVVALVMSQSRGAWIGAVLASIAVGAWAVRTSGEPAERGTVLRWSGAAVVLLAVTVVAVPGVVTRAASLADPTEGTAGGRLELAQMAFGAVGDRPVLGWGPDITRAAMRQQFSGDFEARYSDDRIEDRAHNSLLDVAMVGGIVGLAAVLWFVVEVARAARQRSSDPSAVVAVAAVIAFSSHLFFNFPIPELDVVVWLFAGTLVTASTSRLRVPGYVAGGVATIGALTIGVVSLDALGADRSLRVGVDRENRGELIAAGSDYADAVAGSPDSSRVNEVFARWSLRAGDPISAIAASRAAVAADPSDPYQRELLARSLNAAALSPQAVAAFAIEAEMIAADLVATAPNDGSAHLEWGTALAASGDIEAARDAYQRASELIPGRSEPLRNLGLLAEDAGEIDTAIDYLERALGVNPGDAAAASALERVRSRS